MIGVGEKGCADLKFIARSDGGHASTPARNTPLVRLGKFMAEVDRCRIFKAAVSSTVAVMFRRLASSMPCASCGHKWRMLLERTISQFAAEITPCATATQEIHRIA